MFSFLQDGHFKQNPHPSTSDSKSIQKGKIARQGQMVTWYSNAKGSYGTCAKMTMRQLIGPKKVRTEFR